MEKKCASKYLLERPLLGVSRIQGPNSSSARVFYRKFVKDNRISGTGEKHKGRLASAATLESVAGRAWPDFWSFKRIRL
jgi:hypothetical protein